ncbi:MAG: histidine kinase dimerization/phospho-acceptor domain-containing protein [Promethearchaeia archaeon]
MKKNIIGNDKCFDKSTLKVLEDEFFARDVLKEKRVQEALRTVQLGISDCLLTPLTVINAAAEYALITGPEISEAERKNLLKMILSHTKRLTTKINNLLILSKYEMDLLF